MTDEAQKPPLKSGAAFGLYCGHILFMAGHITAAIAIGAMRFKTR